MTHLGRWRFGWAACGYAAVPKKPREIRLDEINTCRMAGTLCILGYCAAKVALRLEDAERCPSWPKEHDWKSCIPQKGIRGSNPRLSAILATLRRGGRAVECGGLENRFTGEPGNQGSNPCLSAMKQRPQPRGLFCCLRITYNGIRTDEVETR